MTQHFGRLQDGLGTTQGFPREGSFPGKQWDRDSAQRSLDELFSLARQYKSSKAYRELLEFVARFRFYSPFNAMLVHIQMPGAKFVAPPNRWLRKYSCTIRAGARPLVILQPRGPVMFVFDVVDAQPESGALPLPREVLEPFAVRRGQIRGELAKTIENAKRDGVAVSECQFGSQRAGEIHQEKPGKYLEVQIKQKARPEYVHVPLRYGLLLNANHSIETKYATLVHELAHLYCGHLGSPNVQWWPDRRGLTDEVREFEAESVCHLVCGRLGIDNPSEEYLARYLKGNEESEIPPISLDGVMRAAGLIEQMGHERLKPRKEKER